MDLGQKVFWSYSHADNNSDRNRIVQLAEDLRVEYASLTGTELHVFVDRADIKWGDAWRNSIEQALDASTFFIPILSSRYFQRTECRKEMLEFHAQATSRGIAKLLLPLLYFPVADLEKDNPDPLIAISAKLQYVDWSELRLKDQNSTEYRTAIHNLAKRLVELTAEVSAIELVSLQREESSSSEISLGLFDNLKGIEEQLPAWLKAVEDDVVVRASYKATEEVYAERLNKLPKKKGSGGYSSQRIGILHRLAVDELPISKKALELARIYSGQTLKLRPFVIGALRGIEEAPENLRLLTDLKNAINEAILQMKSSPPNEIASAAMFWRERANLGQVFRENAEVHVESERIREETNLVVIGWHERIDRLFESKKQTEASAD